MWCSLDLDMHSLTKAFDSMHFACHSTFPLSCEFTVVIISLLDQIPLICAFHSLVLYCPLMFMPLLVLLFTSCDSIFVSLCTLTISTYCMYDDTSDSSDIILVIDHCCYNSYNTHKDTHRAICLFRPCVNGMQYICITTTLSHAQIWAMLKPVDTKNRLDVTKVNQGRGGWVWRWARSWVNFWANEKD